jgi:hypothetical protein
MTAREETATARQRPAAAADTAAAAAAVGLEAAASMAAVALLLGLCRLAAVAAADMAAAVVMGAIGEVSCMRMEGMGVVVTGMGGIVGAVEVPIGVLPGIGMAGAQLGMDRMTGPFLHGD